MIEEISKYNFWNGNIPELGFLRAEYTNKIHSSLGNNLVKVLVGQRRAGKSFVLRQLAKQLLDSGVPAHNILYINTEYLEFGGLKTVSDLQSLYQEYRDKLQPDGRIYLFLDEIQQAKDWERFVNSHSQDFVESKEIFISGSNSDLLKQIYETLIDEVLKIHFLSLFQHFQSMKPLFLHQVQILPKVLFQKRLLVEF